MKLIVGLGNPGKRYVKTRHNIGFMIVDALHEYLGPSAVSTWTLSKKFNAEVSEGTIKNQKVILMKPMTFMNASGEAVQLIMQYYQIDPRGLLVVHDDKDLRLGTTKLQTNRGHAGHNGVRSIMDFLGSQDFTRLRVGVATDHAEKMEDASTFVLSKFSVWEKKKVMDIIKNSITPLQNFLNE